MDKFNLRLWLTEDICICGAGFIIVILRATIYLQIIVEMDGQRNEYTYSFYCNFKNDEVSTNKRKDGWTETCIHFNRS